MIIRLECPDDEVPIGELTTRAFRVAEHRSGDEAGIVQRLRRAGALALSLVAEEHDQVVGHVAFSRVLIAGRDASWFGLGPISVAPERQRAGIGSSLIRKGLDHLTAREAHGFVVLGDPDYYRRFGFSHDPQITFAEAGAHFQKLAVAGEALHGEVTYSAAFG